MENREVAAQLLYEYKEELEQLNERLFLGRPLELCPSGCRAPPAGSLIPCPAPPELLSPEKVKEDNKRASPHRKH